MTIDPSDPSISPDPESLPHPGREGSAVVTLAAERLRTGTEWVESGRVRLRRRIVSETRTIEVVVRREELIIETHGVIPGPSVGESYRGVDLDGPTIEKPRERAPLVVALREEVPEVVMRPQVYERVIAEVITSDETAVWQGNVAHEEADTAQTAPAQGGLIQDDVAGNTTVVE